MLFFLAACANGNLLHRIMAFSKLSRGVWPRLQPSTMKFYKKSIVLEIFHQMLNLLAITLLAVIVKNPGMMQNINGAMENNYDDVS